MLASKKHLGPEAFGDFAALLAAGEGRAALVRRNRAWAEHVLFCAECEERLEAERQRLEWAAVRVGPREDADALIHLTERDVTALADGTADKRQEEWAERHLRVCHACRDWLARFEATGTWWHAVEIPAAAGGPPTVDVPSGGGSVVARLRFDSEGVPRITFRAEGPEHAGQLVAVEYRRARVQEPPVQRFVALLTWSEAYRCCLADLRLQGVRDLRAGQAIEVHIWAPAAASAEAVGRESVDVLRDSVRHADGDRTRGAWRAWLASDEAAKAPRDHVDAIRAALGTHPRQASTRPPDEAASPEEQAQIVLTTLRDLVARNDRTGIAAYQAGPNDRWASNARDLTEQAEGSERVIAMAAWCAAAATDMTDLAEGKKEALGRLVDDLNQAAGRWVAAAKEYWKCPLPAASVTLVSPSLDPEALRCVPAPVDALLRTSPQDPGVRTVWAELRDLVAYLGGAADAVWTLPRCVPILLDEGSAGEVCVLEFRQWTGASLGVCHRAPEAIFFPARHQGNDDWWRGVQQAIAYVAASGRLVPDVAWAPRSYTASVPLISVIGVSASLGFALGLAGMIDRLWTTAAPFWAVTGEIQASGAIGPVGGLPMKIEAARRHGLNVLLPALNATGPEAQRWLGNLRAAKLRGIPVATFDDAKRFFFDLPEAAAQERERLHAFGARFTRRMGNSPIQVAPRADPDLGPADFWKHLHEQTKDVANILCHTVGSEQGDGNARRAAKVLPSACEVASDLLASARSDSPLELSPQGKQAVKAADEAAILFDEPGQHGISTEILAALGRVCLRNRSGTFLAQSAGASFLSLLALAELGQLWAEGQRVGATDPDLDPDIPRSVYRAARETWGEQWEREMFALCHRVMRAWPMPLEGFEGAYVYLTANRFYQSAADFYGANGRAAAGSLVTITHSTTSGLFSPMERLGSQRFANLFPSAEPDRIAALPKNPHRRANFEQGILNDAIPGIRYYQFAWPTTAKALKEWHEAIKDPQEQGRYRESAVDLAAQALSKPYIELTASEAPFDWVKQRLTRSSFTEQMISFRDPGTRDRIAHGVYLSRRGLASAPEVDALMTQMVKTSGAPLSPIVWLATALRGTAAEVVRDVLEAGALEHRQALADYHEAARTGAVRMLKPAGERGDRAEAERIVRELLGEAS